MSIQEIQPFWFFFSFLLNLAQLNFCYLQQKSLSLSAHIRAIWHCPPKVLNGPWILQTTQFSAWISTLFPLTLLCCYSPTSGGQDFALIEDAMPSVCLCISGLDRSELSKIHGDGRCEWGPLGAFHCSAISAPTRSCSHLFTVQFMLEQRQAKNQINSFQTLSTAHALSSLSLRTANEISTTLPGSSPGPWHKKVKGREWEYSSEYAMTWKWRSQALLWMEQKFFFFLNMFQYKGRWCQRKWP